MIKLKIFDRENQKMRIYAMCFITMILVNIKKAVHERKQIKCAVTKYYPDKRCKQKPGFVLIKF